MVFQPETVLIRRASAFQTLGNVSIVLATIFSDCKTPSTYRLEALGDRKVTETRDNGNIFFRCFLRLNAFWSHQEKLKKGKGANFQ